MINAECYIKLILCTRSFCHLIHISTSLWQNKVEVAVFSHHILKYTPASFNTCRLTVEF